jgi:hypothetical protein
MPTDETRKVRFNPNTMYMTPGIRDLMDNPVLATEIGMALLQRHPFGDWGDLDEEDKQRNEAAIVSGARIWSAYNLSDGTRIRIITEAEDDEGQRSYTTVLLPSEE